MTTLILVIGILLGAACGVAGYIFLRRSGEVAHKYEVPHKNKVADKGQQQIQKPKKAWAVYVIDHPANATICEPARKLHLRHFGESQQCPTLPLKDCDRKDSCQCFQREIVDKRRVQRRQSRERREEFRIDPTKPAKVERRILKDRRAARTEWDGYD